MAWRRSLSCCAPWLTSFWRSSLRSRVIQRGEHVALRTMSPARARASMM
jgi:hypothetical protein